MERGGEIFPSSFLPKKNQALVKLLDQRFRKLLCYAEVLVFSLPNILPALATIGYSKQLKTS